MKNTKLKRNSWKYVFILCLIFFISESYAQSVTGSNWYRVIDLGTNNQGDFTRSLILLHEINWVHLGKAV
ncbi:hypothetical protein [Arcticibacter sp.]|uniref:hypothetical protein n=1 Tax=Arcticibacter sp. TaxID=1872630 RepID=UPI00388E92A4